MEQGKYYRHSGAFSIGGLLLASILGTVGVAIAAVLYAALVLYIPLAGFITFILTAGFGVVAGGVSGMALKWGKLRNNGLATLVGVLFGAEAVYVSWAAWTTLLLWRSDVEASGLALAASPGVLWSVASEINQVGAWSLRGFTPTGGFLWLLWGVEALLVFGLTALVSMGMTAVPFCERCERWCEEEENVARFAASDAERVKREAESQPLEFLTSLGPPPEQADTFLRADLHSCPGCHQTHALTLQSVTVTLNKDERKESATEVLRHLLVPSSVAEGVRGLA